MTLYTNMAKTALRQIADKGRNVSLRANTEGVYDPVTDSFTGTLTNDTTVKALVTAYSQREIDGTIILRGDKKILIAANAASPEHNDIIVDGANEYKIINVDTLKPGDTPIMYTVQVRK